LSGRIFTFELNGNTVLGFDTGLNAQAFAQAKMVQYITRPGTIVYPDGIIETWQPGGTAELAIQSVPTMVIWGPSFPGTRLDEIINDHNRPDEALDALRYWLRARIILDSDHRIDMEAPFPGPAGAFIMMKEQQGPFPPGTVFFPPARIIKRILDGAEAEFEAGTSAGVTNAGTTPAERWVHPDLEGAEAVAFSAGVMLYHIFCGSSPFPEEDRASLKLSPQPRRRAHGDKNDELRRNIREEVFVPPNLVKPGLDPELSGLVARAMSRVSQNNNEKSRPAPDTILGFIGPPASRPVSSWIKALNGEEVRRIQAEHDRYAKKKARTVKTRRFMIRNTALIAGAIIALMVLSFVIRGAAQHRAELPTTRGMDPIEVVAAYYSAFDALDHSMMEACVSGKAGRKDIEMTANLFVIGRMRQAYEMTGELFMSAKDWIDAGHPATDKIVFGITDLKISVLSLKESEAGFEADYILWMPGASPGEGEDTSSFEEATKSEEYAPLPAWGMAVRDRLNLVTRKGVWRITEIGRESRPLQRISPTAYPQATGR